MDFPEKFVDEALGFAVGIMYWSVVEEVEYSFADY